MLRFLFILVLPLVLTAEDWALFRSGPFEVYSAAGNQAGRQALNELEQLRAGLRQTLLRDDLHSVWPIRLVVFDSARQAEGYPLNSMKLARDSWVGATVGEGRTPIRACLQILLDSNANRMGEEIEKGLLAVFSTLDVDGTIVTLGAPVPPAERDRDWARIHMLTVSPEYGGKAAVLFSNLERGADPYAAYKNAFSKIPKQIQAEAEAYLAAGQFATRRLSGAPIDPRRDFRAREVDPLLMRAILADLMDGDAARAAYASILNDAPTSPEALEGLDKLAEAADAGSEYQEASRAWSGAERAAVDEAERKRIGEARVRVQAQRAEFLQKQRREEREKREKELAQLREDMMSRIRAAEQEANAADPNAPEGREVVDWWEDERPKAKVSGTLERVDCPRGAIVLVVKSYGDEEVRLKVADPARIVILGGGEATLGCGPQSPPRNVSVEYFTDADETNKTAGEVAAVDFR